MGTTDENIQQPTSNIQHPTSNDWMLDVGCRMFFPSVFDCVYLWL
jgi:hypothetical protein